MKYRVVCSLATLLLIAGCKPSPEHEAKLAEERQRHCLDHFCEGDVDPRRDVVNDELLKFNGQWFIGPKEYFSGGINGASFQWWEHKPLSRRMPIPPQLQQALAAGHGDEFSVEIFLRSTNIPQQPYGYALIELAEKSDWIASRKTLRPGLDVVTMKDVIGPHGQRINHVSYYVATELKGVDGLPPVSSCSFDTPSSGGGTGFVWQPGIWAGTRMNHKHCADWPEIYTEVIRVLNLLKRA